MAKKKKDTTQNHIIEKTVSGHDTDSEVLSVYYKLLDPATSFRAQRMLLEAGITPFLKAADGWIVHATRKQIEKLTSTRIKEKTETRWTNGVQHDVKRLRFHGLPNGAPPPLDSDKLGRFVFPVPSNNLQLSAYPPLPAYYHIHPSRDFAYLFGVDPLHARGVRGRGIRVAMVDTGFFPHPYYKDLGIHGGRAPLITTHAAITNPNLDDFGHGTAIAANLFAIAPDCDFHHVKKDGDDLAALIMARSLNPAIITCSWGWDEAAVQNAFVNDPTGSDALYYGAVQTEIQTSLAAQISVFFSSGNLANPPAGPGNWPSSLPGVVSVGGAYVDETFKLSASSLATSFASILTPGRHCPDVCGLVGPAPFGLLFPLPTQPGSTIDAVLGPKDGTSPNDGWCVTSGTSSAAPQIAGIAALLLQMYGAQTPQQIQTRLQDMAVNVQTGHSATGEAANFHRPNPATGYGWVTFRRPQKRNGYYFF